MMNISTKGGKLTKLYTTNLFTQNKKIDELDHQSLMW